MGDPLDHAKSSAAKYGGVPEDYAALHHFFDDTKAFVGDWRHRAILHTTFGIFLAEKMFGNTITRASDGVKVSTRLLAAQHIQEDLNFIPTPLMFLRTMPIEAWHNGASKGMIDMLRYAQDGKEINHVWTRIQWFKLEKNKPPISGEYYLVETSRGETFTAAWDSTSSEFTASYTSGVFVVDDVVFWAEKPRIAF